MIVLQGAVQGSSFWITNSQFTFLFKTGADAIKLSLLGSGSEGNNQESLIDVVADQTVEVGKSIDVNVTTEPAEATVSAESSNTNVARVSVQNHTLTITGLAEGIATINVTAKKAGYTDGTANFKISVTRDTTPPTVASTDPANNATGVPVDKAITVTFSEAVQ